MTGYAFGLPVWFAAGLFDAMLTVFRLLFVAVVPLGIILLFRTIGAAWTGTREHEHGSDI